MESRRLVLLCFANFCYHPAPTQVAESAEAHSAGFDKEVEALVRE
jgi:hypothetical protein